MPDLNDAVWGQGIPITGADKMSPEELAEAQHNFASARRWAEAVVWDAIYGDDDDA